MRARFLPAAACLALAAAPHSGAAILHRHAASARHSAGPTARKRLHVNDLIAEPGTVEIDWGAAWSYTTTSLTLPSALKFTPAGNSQLVGRTEYSVSFDSLSSAADSGSRATQFSDRLTFAATSVAFDSPHFDIAVAPQATALLRGDTGVRLGATVIARYDGGGNTLAAAASWTAATSPSDSNPAGAWDYSAGYAHSLGRITPHTTVILEKLTGFDRTLSVAGGIEYQVTAHLAFDLSAQRNALTGAPPDRQVLLGLTLNLGKTH